jgi:hypothetical protein
MSRTNITICDGCGKPISDDQLALGVYQAPGAEGYRKVADLHDRGLCAQKWGRRTRVRERRGYAGLRFEWDGTPDLTGQSKVAPSQLEAHPE